jgi:transcriptional regulator with XRE-family HTH domain
MRTPTDLDRLIGTNIRRYRQRLDWTQGRLADELEISCQQLQKIERGVNRISGSRLFQTSDVFCLPVEVFRHPIVATAPGQGGSSEVVSLENAVASYRSIERVLRNQALAATHLETRRELVRLAEQYGLLAELRDDLQTFTY